MGLTIISTILNLLYLRMTCANFGYNWPSISGEVENVKSNRQTGGQTSDEQQAMRKVYLS
jgi:hypothetical protein